MISMIIGFLLMLPLFSAADSECSWKNIYGNNYWNSRGTWLRPEGLVRKALETNPRYQYLLTQKKLGIAEAAEKVALEKGYTNRHAELLGLKAAEALSKIQQLELTALEHTNGNVEAGRLAIKGHNLSDIEKARYNALLTTRGDFRAAYLAELKARGNLTDKAEQAELDALLKSKGDKRFADYKRARAVGANLKVCEMEELAFIEEQIKPTDSQEAKMDRLPAPEDGQNAL
ncbi:MAG: hypothetical protein IT287_09305 [Bdellovibrionaceae bacterium]|nr:hypothetical protein [Pseudobdellovibrionaceae bacterium]